MLVVLQKLLADMNLKRVTKLRLVGTPESLRVRLNEEKRKVCTRSLALVQNALAHTLCTARPRKRPSACTTSSLRALYYVRSGNSSNYNNNSTSTTTLTSLAPRRP